MRPRIFLSRRSLGEGGCSMRITEDVRKFAAEQKLSEGEALQAGLEQKLASLAKQEPKSILTSETACRVRSLLSRGSAAKAGSGGRVGRSFAMINEQLGPRVSHAI